LDEESGRRRIRICNLQSEFRSFGNSREKQEMLLERAIRANNIATLLAALQIIVATLTVPSVAGRAHTYGISCSSCVVFTYAFTSTFQIARNRWAITSRRLINVVGSTVAVHLRSRRAWCDTSRGGTSNRPRRTRTAAADECSGTRRARKLPARACWRLPRPAAKTNSPACGKDVRVRGPSTRDTNCSFTCACTHKRSRTSVRLVSSSRLLLAQATSIYAVCGVMTSATHVSRVTYCFCYRRAHRHTLLVSPVHRIDSGMDCSVKRWSMSPTGWILLISDWFTTRSVESRRICLKVGRVHFTRYDFSR